MYLRARIPIFLFSSGPARDAFEFSLVAFDGEDGCTEYKPTCGVDSRQFALFLLDYMKVETAMELDQGGSTAMCTLGFRDFFLF